MKMASRSIDLISKKTDCTCSTLFFLISKKQICLSLPLFCTPTTLFFRTKTSNFLVTRYFYGGIVVCAYPIFCLLCSCSLLVFTAAHFTFLAASISHCLTAALKFHVFLPTKFVSFVFNHSLLLFLSNNVEKDTTLLLFFLSKSLGGHAIFFQIKPCVTFGLPYLLIELFYIGMPVVRTDGRAIGVRSHDYQIFSDG